MVSSHVVISFFFAEVVFIYVKCTMTQLDMYTDGLTGLLILFYYFCLSYKGVKKGFFV